MSMIDTLIFQGAFPQLHETLKYYIIDNMHTLHIETKNN